VLALHRLISVPERYGSRGTGRSSGILSLTGCLPNAVVKYRRESRCSDRLQGRSLAAHQSLTKAVAREARTPRRAFQDIWYFLESITCASSTPFVLARLARFFFASPKLPRRL
jgi:hypothetical protein